MDRFIGIKRRRYFVYNQVEKKSYFSTQKVGKCVCDVIGLNMCLVASGSDLLELEDTRIPTPLLKSNIQKAIRRGDEIVAISSTMALLKSNPLELLRRLPIIMIEDVCLFDTITTLVWLILAHGHHRIDICDQEIITSTVHSLCKEQSCFKYIETNNIHNTLTMSDCCLALHYRKLYGGMKCDIKLLDSAIDYYTNNNQIKTCKMVNIQVKPILILDVSIDFHVFPWILEKISKATDIDIDTIKSLIWDVNSALNWRKDETIVKHGLLKKTDNWIKISPILAEIRAKIMCGL